MSFRSERRRTTRTRLVRTIAGQDLSSKADVRIRDISPTAFSVESPTAYAIGSHQVFLFNLGEGETLELAGAVKRCEGAPLHPPMRFIVGLDYVWNKPNERARTEALIRKLARGLSG